MRRISVPMLLLAGAMAQAQTPVESIAGVEALHAQARAAQARIDRLDEQIRALRTEGQLIEYQGTADALEHRDLEAQIGMLTTTMATLDADLRAINGTRNGLLDLLTRMTDALARFIEMDLPFRLTERRAVIDALRAQLPRSDISSAAKYQAVITAYIQEIRHGLHSEVALREVETPSGTRVAEVLRHGRVGMWYLTPDAARAGRWDRAARRWVEDGLVTAGEIRAAIAALGANPTDTDVLLPVDMELR